MVERGAIEHVVQRDKASGCVGCVIELCHGVAGVAEFGDEELPYDVWRILPESDFGWSRWIDGLELCKGIISDDDLGLP